MHKTNCIVSIVERDKVNRVLSVYEENGCCPFLEFLAKGTASNEMLDLLGFSTDKRAIVLSLADEKTSQNFIRELKTRERIQLHTKGIVFVCPVNAISSGLYFMMSKSIHHSESEEIREMNHDSLVLVSINQGYSNDVIHTAKKYGAKGGTVFKANWRNDECLENEFHKEKEILAIVTTVEKKKELIQHIHQEHGPESKAQALIIAVPVTDKVIL